MTIEAAGLVGLLAGLFGSPHCAAMCGGIVGLLHSQLPSGRDRLAFGFHAGRIASYLGLATLVATFGALPAAVLPDGAAGFMRLALGLVILLMALYIGLPGSIRDFAGGWVAPLTRRLLAPMSRLLPADTWSRALGLGLMWGLLPCGLLYTVLGAAWLTADLTAALALVGAFGLGTVPLLLGGALATLRLKSRFRSTALRVPAALVLGLTGVLVAVGPWLAASLHHPAMRFLVDCVVG